MSGRVYPSGDISVGFVPPEKKRKADRDYDRQHSDSKYEFDTFSGSYRGLQKEEHSYYKCEVDGSLPLSSTSLSNSPKNVARNNLSESSSPERPAVYGLRGITSHGKKMLKSGCRLLEDLHGKQRLAFLTVTLPDALGGLPTEKLKIVHESWSSVVKNFLKALSRDLENLGADKRIVCSSEIQEKRFASSGIPALHLHLVFHAWDGVSRHPDNKRAFYLSVSRIRLLWSRVISNLLAVDTSTLNFNASVNIQTIRKSASGYLGKYISKGVKVAKKVVEAGLSSWLPKQWWSLSGGLGSDVRACVISLNSDVCTFFVEHLDAFIEKDILKKYYEIFAFFGDEEVRVGYAGLFSPFGLIDFYGIIASFEALDTG
jgi:hypothetical protein